MPSLFGGWFLCPKHWSWGRSRPSNHDELKRQPNIREQGNIIVIRQTAICTMFDHAWLITTLGGCLAPGWRTMIWLIGRLFCQTVWPFFVIMSATRTPSWQQSTNSCGWKLSLTTTSWCLRILSVFICVGQTSWTWQSLLEEKSKVQWLLLDSTHFMLTATTKPTRRPSEPRWTIPMLFPFKLPTTCSCTYK